MHRRNLHTSYPFASVYGSALNTNDTSRSSLSHHSTKLNESLFTPSRLKSTQYHRSTPIKSHVWAYLVPFSYELYIYINGSLYFSLKKTPSIVQCSHDATFQALQAHCTNLLSLFQIFFWSMLDTKLTYPTLVALHSSIPSLIPSTSTS